MKCTKKAFLSAVVALIICFTMLIGTTLAWFTDSANVGIQTIQTGELNLTVEDANGDTWESRELKWVSADANKTTNWWEPGATYLTEEFTIKNEGNLNLKFQISLNLPANNMLLDVITFDILADSSAFMYDGNQPMSAIFDLLEGYETATGEYVFDYVLVPGAEVGPLTIRAHMAESAGNEYMNQVIDNISFTILATQATGDVDSFDGYYDDGLILGEEDGIMMSENNVDYLYTDDGEVYVYEVTEDYAESTFVVPENVTAIASNAFASNPNVKEVILSESVRELERAFEYSMVEKVVLNEGLETISSRAFIRTNALQEVVIPSTVTTIADNAFQRSAITRIVIPANVQTIGETAFGASKIKEVIFEGNIEVQGRAFRGASELEKVVFMGDDVDFVASTLGNYKDMWIGNFENVNFNVNNKVVFYVQNEVVAEKVLVAMGDTAATIKVYIGDEDVKTQRFALISRNANRTVSGKTINDFQYVLNSIDCDTVIKLTTDVTADVTVNQIAGTDIVIDGNGKTFKGLMTIRGGGHQFDNDTLVIKNFNFSAKKGADSCILSPEYDATLGHPVTHNVTIENCTFTDTDGTVDCAAIRQKDNGDLNWTIKNCTVDSTIHSLLQVNNVGGKLVIEGCTVNSKNGVNLVSSANVDVIGCAFDNKGYNIRYGVNSGGNDASVVKTFLVKDCTLKSENDDGDGNITIRKDAQTNSTLTLENVTFTSFDTTLEIVGSVTNLIK